MAQPGASDSGEFSRPMRAAAALRRMCPDVEGFHFPREPNEPYYFEPEPYNIVWHMHNGTWRLALVLRPAVSPNYDPSTSSYRSYFGLVQDSNGFGLEQALLCPSLGWTKPESPYTRLLLKTHGKIPNDDCIIEDMVRKFDIEVRRAYIARCANA